ncbi:MAG TPA: HD family phosphohydrolase [Lactococcus sp.]|uniref:HD domain-containing protein n=1 Tax=Lactococcus TaxID=1357 RepID=UPI000E8B5BC6|nr:MULTISPECIES: HD domain-containing protein [Lactococcus]HAP15803.1 HD family phosphohydrolase [Lactococcus sp.]HBC89853.1 HD family phosphohydrolase [Lactococcus sp.]
MTTQEKIAAFAKKIYENNYDGHGFDHVSRVVKLAKQILATEPLADSDLVIAAAYLHDTYDEKICSDVAQQKQEVAAFLTSLDFSKEKQDKIFYIIDNMSYSANLLEKKELDINGQIVQDADRIDAMGAWGIVRTLEYGWSKGRTLYDPTIKPQHFSSKSNYHQSEGTTLNHFYEKLFLLKDLLNTAHAKKLAQKRDKIMRDFVTAIEEEYDS